MSESGKPGRPTAQAEETAEFPQDGDFLQRWSQRKAQARVATQPQAKEAESQARDAGTGPPAEAPGDEDMPPLETLDQDSDYSGFLSPRVSEELRRLALRKLFHGPKFNITDGMDDYAGDYSKMEPLGDIVTADMRFHMERAKERLAEAEKQLRDLAGDPPEQPAALGTSGVDIQGEDAGAPAVASGAELAPEPEDQENDDESGDR
jgi:hypothetical protein